jgi:hypothetical protein
MRTNIEFYVFADIQGYSRGLFPKVHGNGNFSILCYACDTVVANRQTLLARMALNWVLQ